jgi:hypothetical protein
MESSHAERGGKQTRDTRPPANGLPSPSKSSVASSQPRAHTHSANSSSSQVDRVSHSSQASHNHKFHHVNCGSSAGSGRDKPRPRPLASRDSRDSQESKDTRDMSDDARSVTTPAPTSAFLHERLQRERKVESERSSSRMSNERPSHLGDGRTVQSSPARATTIDGGRPRSSQGEALKRKGLGLKEVEQVCWIVAP